MGGVIKTPRPASHSHRRHPLPLRSLEIPSMAAGRMFALLMVWDTWKKFFMQYGLLMLLAMPRGWIGSSQSQFTPRFVT